MKKALLFFVFSILVSLASADEFIVRNFGNDLSDLSARKNERLDANDERCAIIKIRTDLRNLRFDSNLNIVGDVGYINGEYWLYVSPGEKRISIYKDGFITLHYTIPLPVVSSIVYILEITNKEKRGAATGSLTIETIPEGAFIEIRQLPDLRKNSPFELKNYPAFPYNITITKPRYLTIDTVLSILPDENITHLLTLVPLWGDLIIQVDPYDAEVYIDSVFIGKGTQQLRRDDLGIDLGQHTISARKDRYYPDTVTIDIVRGDNGTIEFSLSKITGTLEVTSQPAGATVYIDSLIIGNTPLNIHHQIGNYNLAVVLDDHLPINKTITISENEVTKVAETPEHYKMVRISSQPTGADIYLNNEFMGVTPVKIPLSYGKNLLRLTKTNFEDYSDTVYADPVATRLDINMNPLKYAVNIQSFPVGANLYLDDKFAGQTPLSEKLEFGHYRIRLEKEGYFKKRGTIDVSGEGQSQDFRLATLNHYRLGVVYGINSWGGEFSWFNNRFGMTLGYHQPHKEVFTNEVRHKNINPDEYPGLSTSLPVGKETNTDSLQMDLYLKTNFALRKIPTLSLTFGFALRYYAYSDVYFADADYEHLYNGDVVLKDTYYSVGRSQPLKVAPIIGASLRLLRYFYVSADWWFNTGEGTQFFIGGGICLPKRH